MKLENDILIKDKTNWKEEYSKWNSQKNKMREDIVCTILLVFLLVVFGTGAAFLSLKLFLGHSFFGCFISALGAIILICAFITGIQFVFFFLKKISTSKKRMRVAKRRIDNADKLFACTWKQEKILSMEYWDGNLYVICVNRDNTVQEQKIPCLLTCNAEIDHPQIVVENFEICLQVSSESK